MSGAVSNPFYYIKGREGALLDVFTEDEIKTGLIVRDEVKLCYYFFSSYREAFDALRAQEKTPSWHEVILDFMPQRLRLDIDIPIDEDFDTIIPSADIMKAVHKNNDENIEICSVCRFPLGSCNVCSARPIYMKTSNDLRADYILREILTAYHRHIPGVNYVLCSSHGEKKYSFHVITNAYSTSSHHVHHLCEQIFAKLPAKIQKYYDKNVCSAGTHNLRLCGCVKPGDTRIKKIEGEDITFEMWRETLVSYISINCKNTSSGVPPPESDMLNNRAAGNIITEVSKEFLEVIKPYHIGLRMVERTGNILSFRREYPSLCPICKRIHDNENSFYVILHTNYARLKCRRAGAQEGISITLFN